MNLSRRGHSRDIAVERERELYGRAWERQFSCLRNNRGFVQGSAVASTGDRGFGPRFWGPQSRIRGKARSARAKREGRSAEGSAIARMARSRRMGSFRGISPESAVDPRTSGP
jgi:hypothetical protein